jgi:hypothetical protein
MSAAVAGRSSSLLRPVRAVVNGTRALTILGYRSMVGRWALTPAIKVRILVTQPIPLVGITIGREFGCYPKLCRFESCPTSHPMVV